MSTQDSDYQREVVERLRLPFEMLADTELGLTRALSLPTFQAAGMTLLRRLTLNVRCEVAVNLAGINVLPRPGWTA